MGAYRRFLDKTLRITLSGLMILSYCPRDLFANPTGESLVSGNANFDRPDPATFNVNQLSDNIIVNYDSFSIAGHETVNFFQPSSSSVALNRVTGGSISEIFGTLNANGNIFLINPNGVLFGRGSRVNVGGIVASSLDMDNGDFLAGRYKFSKGVGPGSFVINQGAITANQGGGVSLIGGAVRNDGEIYTRLGSVNLASGEAATLNLDNRGLLVATVTDTVKNQILDNNNVRMRDSVSNSGTISADGSVVSIRSEAVSGVFDNLINQSGVVHAGSLNSASGQISLISNSGGLVINSGSINVSSVDDSADAGTVLMQGSHVGQFGQIHADSVNGNAGRIDLLAREAVALSSGSLTTANAQLNGNGGRITAFSPETALFRNNALIEAKGGVESGDGGFVEVSGKEHVEIYGLVDTRALNGRTGNFLIDPYNITISSDPDANPAVWPGTPFAPTATGSIINDGTLETQLGLSSIEITTVNGAGAEDGDITINADIAYNGDNDLTLTADDDIIFDTLGSITLSGGGSSLLTLTAGNGAGVDGAIVNSNNRTIALDANDDLRLIADTGIGTFANPLLTTGLVDVAATTGTGGIFLSNSGAGDINIASVGGTNGLSTTTSGNISVANTGGNISLA